MASIPAPRGGFSTPFTFHPAVCVCIPLLACTSERPHPACRQLSCPEPRVGSAPAVWRGSPQCSWGGKPEQEGSACPGHTPLCRATGQTLLGWLWVVPTCHQLAGSHGHLHSHAPGQGASPESTNRSRQPAAKHPGAGTGANRGCPSARLTAASWRGQNPPSTREMLVFVAVISQRGNTESKMHNQDPSYTSCVF